MKQIFLLLILVANLFAMAQKTEKVSEATEPGHINTLYVVANHGKKKVRIKEGELIQIISNNFTDTAESTVQSFNKNGVFYIPQRVLVDTTYLDSLNTRYNLTHRYVKDTIHFITYQDIDKIFFTKNLAKRGGKNILMAGIGTWVAIAPLARVAIGEGTIGPGEVAVAISGVVVTAYSIWRIKRLYKRKEYSMLEYHFDVEG